MHRQRPLRSLSPTENVISSILKSRVGLRAVHLWCNENCPLYYLSGLSFYLAGIQDVITSKDIGVARELWPACVSEARKENKGLLGWHIVVDLDVKYTCSTSKSRFCLQLCRPGSMESVRPLPNCKVPRHFLLNHSFSIDRSIEKVVRTATSLQHISH
jgi:hypothetical protein